MQLSPSLTGQLRGIVLRELNWHGRVFTVSIGPATTTVRLQTGPPLPVTVAGVTHTVAPGGTFSVPTRRPDRQPTTDLTRCQQASASSAQPGADPLAAVDGSPATDWQPRQITSSLTVRLARRTVIWTATLEWGLQWPPPPAPNVHPPPGPVTTLRASSYDLVASQDGRHWTVVARGRNRTAGTRDVLNFTPVHARYVGLRITSATHHTPPMLDELTCK